jgi:hypothetical protein
MYDVYHKGKEIITDIVCPSCGSTGYKKLISAPSVSVGNGHQDKSMPGSSCGNDGGCCGGACHMN